MGGRDDWIQKSTISQKVSGAIELLVLCLALYVLAFAFLTFLAPYFCLTTTTTTTITQRQPPPPDDTKSPAKEDTSTGTPSTSGNDLQKFLTRQLQDIWESKETTNIGSFAAMTMQTILNSNFSATNIVKTLLLGGTELTNNNSSSDFAQALLKKVSEKPQYNQIVRRDDIATPYNSQINWSSVAGWASAVPGAFLILFVLFL